MFQPRRMLMMLAAIVFAATAFAPSALAQTKIGVFDPQRVSEETVEGKRIQDELAKMRDSKQAEIQTKRSRIEQLAKQLEEEALTLSQEKRTALEVQIQRLRLDLENATQLATQELQLEISAAQANFNERLNLAVQQYGKSQGFDLILDTSIVAFMSSAVDVTTGIIDIFDSLKVTPEGGGSGSGTP